MLARFRARLTYANVVATLALFIALGGTSFAALNLTGRDIKNRSLTRVDIKRDTLTGAEINESRLRTVPRAARAVIANEANIAKNADVATQATNATNASLAAVAADAQKLAGQGAGAFEKSSRVQFASAPAAPAGESGEQVLLSWPEMGVNVTSASPAGSGCATAIAVRNTKASGPSALVFEEGGPGPVVAPGGKGYHCVGDADVHAQVTDSTNRTLFVDCILAQGQIRCLGVRSEP